MSDPVQNAAVLQRRRVVADAIRAARTHRGWSYERLIKELYATAGRTGRTLPNADSLKAMLSRWENAHRAPDNYNLAVLCDTLDLPYGQLRRGLSTVSDQE
jgi:transcriptional regulator with XRE-family HTH domain